MSDDRNAGAARAEELGRRADEVHAAYRKAADEAFRLRAEHRIAYARYLDARAQVCSGAAEGGKTP